MSTRSSHQLTPTSYALLGLLALQPWTTYELAQQMRRAVRWFWPRAERKLYDEPKRLVELGLATSRSEMTGRRASTVYEITPAGRSALRSWSAAPDFAPPSLEMEGMVRLFFAEHGTMDDLQHALRRVRAQAEEALAELCDTAEPAVEGRDPYPQRRALNAVNLELMVRLHETISEWAVWAEDEIGTWPAVRRQRREVAEGPRERGTELMEAIRARRPRR